MGKAIDDVAGTVLFHDDFSAPVEQNYWATDGTWWTENNALYGRHLPNSGALLYTKKSFEGDVLMDFYGMTIAPCNNDLNFTWANRGWDEKANRVEGGYIAGLGGWWNNKVGIERYPDCKVAAASGLLLLEAGKEYHIQAGSVNGHGFIFVEGELAIEMFDSWPIVGGAVGFGAYSSFIRIRDFTLRQIVWKPDKRRYTPQFDQYTPYL